MQTRIAVDANLLRQAAETTGLASRRELVEHAIRVLLAEKTGGQNSWQPSLLGESQPAA